MIKTPSGHYINPEIGLVIKVSNNPDYILNYPDDNTKPLPKDFNPELDYAIEHRLPFTKTPTILGLFKTKEEAQTALDKMFMKNESGSINLEFLKAGNLYLIKGSANPNNDINLKYLKSSDAYRIINKLTDETFQFNTLQEAIQKFNRIEI